MKPIASFTIVFWGLFCLGVTALPTELGPMEQTQWLLQQLGPEASSRRQAGAMTMDYGLRLRGKPQMIFLGDSITGFGFYETPAGGPDPWGFGPDYRGWAVRLNETLQQQAELINLSLKAGTNTKGFNQSMPLFLEQLKAIAKEVVLVHIAFGANDAILNNPGWHQPVPVYVQVLSNAIHAIRDLGIKNVMLTTPPPVGFRHPEGPDRVNCYTVLYARRLQRTGMIQKPLVPVANTYDALMAQPDWEHTMLQTDALHLSAAGNKVMYDTVWSTIQANFPEISAAGLPEWYKRQSRTP